MLTDLISGQLSMGINGRAGGDVAREFGTPAPLA